MEETGENGKGDDKSHKYKYYELDFLRKGESKTYKKYFKSKEDALKHYQNLSTYTLNKSKPNDPYDLNINRNYQVDLAETQF